MEGNEQTDRQRALSVLQGQTAPAWPSGSLPSTHPRILGLLSTFSPDTRTPCELLNAKHVSPPPMWGIPVIAPTSILFPVGCLPGEGAGAMLLRGISFVPPKPNTRTRMGFRRQTLCWGVLGSLAYRSAVEPHKTLNCCRSYRRTERSSQRNQTLEHPSLNNCRSGLGALKQRRKRCRRGREQAKACATYTAGDGFGSLYQDHS